MGKSGEPGGTKNRLKEYRGPPVAGPILFGLVVATAALGGLSAFATVATMSGAVIAPGVVVVEDRTKRVQHQEGGIVAKILVDDGVAVKAGDVLVRLDDTQMRTRLMIVLKQLAQTNARVARLKAERDKAAEPKFATPASDDEREAIETERAFFHARREALLNQRTQYQQRIVEIEKGIEGLAADMQSIDEQHAIAIREHAGLNLLFEQKNLPITRVLALQREMAGLKGRRGQRVSDIAKSREQITETRIQLINLEVEFQRDVLRDLAASEAKIAELVERKISAEDFLNRIDIRAPQAGVVQDMAVHTIGGVIRPGESLMIIVPRNAKLVVESRVSPIDIDQVAVGSRAVVRLVNFNRRMTPELDAKVAVIAADVTDTAMQNNGRAAAGAPQLPYYAARLEILESELVKLEGGKLQPGMQVETFIQTDDRTVMSYLLKPITDRMVHAMRER